MAFCYRNYIKGWVKKRRASHKKSHDGLFFVPFFLFVFFVSSLPSLVLAADIVAILTTIKGFLGTIISIIIGLAFVTFLWGMYKYISAASEGGKEEGRNIIIYGIIGLFVMVAVWGLVTLLQTTFLSGVQLTAPPQPKFPGQ